MRVGSGWKRERSESRASATARSSIINPSFDRSTRSARGRGAGRRGRAPDRRAVAAPPPPPPLETHPRPPPPRLPACSTAPRRRVVVPRLPEGRPTTGRRRPVPPGASHQAHRRQPWRGCGWRARGPRPLTGSASGVGRRPHSLSAAGPAAGARRPRARFTSSTMPPKRAAPAGPPSQTVADLLFAWPSDDDEPRVGLSDSGSGKRNGGWEGALRGVGMKFWGERDAGPFSFRPSQAAPAGAHPPAGARWRCAVMR